jgi:hypothetical protein
MHSATDLIVKVILNNKGIYSEIKTHLAPHGDPYLQAQAIKNYCSRQLFRQGSILSEMQSALIHETFQMTCWSEVVVRLKHATPQSILKPQKCVEPVEPVAPSTPTEKEESKDEEIIYL